MRCPKRNGFMACSDSVVSSSSDHPCPLKTGLFQVCSPVGIIELVSLQPQYRFGHDFLIYIYGKLLPEGNGDGIEGLQ